MCQINTQPNDKLIKQIIINQIKNMKDIKNKCFSDYCNDEQKQINSLIKLNQ